MSEATKLSERIKIIRGPLVNVDDLLKVAEYVDERIEALEAKLEYLADIAGVSPYDDSPDPKPKAAEWLRRFQNITDRELFYRKTKSGGLDLRVLREVPERWISCTRSQDDIADGRLVEVEPASPDSVPWRLRRWAYETTGERVYRLVAEHDARPEGRYPGDGEWRSAIFPITKPGYTETWPATPEEDGREEDWKELDQQAMSSDRLDAIAEHLRTQEKPPRDEVAEVVEKLIEVSHHELDDTEEDDKARAKLRRLFTNILAPILAKAREDRETLAEIRDAMKAGDLGLMRTSNGKVTMCYSAEAEASHNQHTDRIINENIELRQRAEKAEAEVVALRKVKEQFEDRIRYILKNSYPNYDSIPYQMATEEYEKIPRFIVSVPGGEDIEVVYKLAANDIEYFIQYIADFTDPLAAVEKARG